MDQKFTKTFSLIVRALSVPLNCRCASVVNISMVAISSEGQLNVGWSEGVDLFCFFLSAAVSTQ